MIPSARLLHDAVFAVLDAIPDLTVYDGKVDTDPPKAADDTVLGYAVLYANAGRAWPTPELALCAVPTDLDWSWQVTCAGGDEQRCLWAVDLVRDSLTGKRITVAGALTSVIREDVDTGPIRRDDAVQPPRFYLPLLYQVAATAA